MKIKFSEDEFSFIMKKSNQENKSAVRVVRDCINQVINQKTNQEGSLHGSNKQ